MSTDARPVTIWARIVDGVLQHNHIEDGHVEGDVPRPLKPEFTHQKSWASYKWTKTYAHLVDGKVVNAT